MSQNQPDSTQADPTAGPEQPGTGIDADPSRNTAPPSNPPVDADAVAQGKEKLESIVNW